MQSSSKGKTDMNNIKLEISSKIVNLEEIINPNAGSIIRILDAQDDRSIEEMDDMDIRKLILEQLSNDATDEFSLKVDGEIKYENSNCEIRYYQYSDDCRSKTLNRIVFKESDPETVTILKSGELCSRMTFSRTEKYIKALYQFDFGKIEMNVFTKYLKNTVESDNGEIILHYLLDVSEGVSQYCEISIKIKPIINNQGVM